MKPKVVLYCPCGYLNQPHLSARVSPLNRIFAKELKPIITKRKVRSMKTYASIISLSILPFFLLMSCNLGPTKKQVHQAMEATFRSLESSLDEHEDIEVGDMYVNAADFVFKNRDGSVVTAMSIIMSDDGVQVYGSSAISDYADVKSDYIINGELTYNLWAPLNLNADEAYGEVSGSMQLSGGKIESLEFSVNGDFNGDEDYIITANDQLIDLNNYNNFFKMMEDLTGKVRG